MKNRTLLVDSSYLLKKSYFGAKDANTNSFGFMGGLYSFYMSLRKLIREHKINKVVLVWDGENGGVERHRIDPSYKANRKNKSWCDKIELSEYEIKKEEEKEQSVLKNRKRIQAYAEELFLRQIEIDEIEADDIIAEYCIRYNNKEDIIIYTNDRDFSQLLDLNITIVFGNIDKPINKHNYSYYFNYHYSNALTMKIICGDTADNIQGIRGIKDKTLLKYFPEMQYRKMTVKEICKKSKIINEERIQTNKKPYKSLSNLLENIDRLKMNFRLTNLSTPFLNEQAYDELEQMDMPLSPEGRSSKNLYKMMNEDEFFTLYKGGFVTYVEPFYSVIANEKDIYNRYKKNNIL